MKSRARAGGGGDAEDDGSAVTVCDATQRCVEGDVIQEGWNRTERRKTGKEE